MYFVIIEEKKAKYDAIISGVLLNHQDQIIPDVFNKGLHLPAEYKDGLKIIANSNWTKTGLLPDKLFTKVHVNIPFLVFSRDAVDLLKKHSKGIDFYPLEIHHGPKVIDECYTANILYKIDCADYQASEIDFEWYDDNDKGHGDIHEMNSLVIDRSKIEEQVNIFLLGRYGGQIVIVHQRLKEAIEQAGLTGFTFLATENFAA